MTDAATRTRTQLAEGWEAWRNTPAQEPAWLSGLREDALEAFRALGVPTIRQEEWRFTPLKQLAAEAFRPSVPADATTVTAENVASFFQGCGQGPRLVFVNGWFRPDLSTASDTSADVSVCALSQVLADISKPVESLFGANADRHRLPFVALNTAFFGDAAYVRVPAGKAIDDPVAILHLATADAPLMASPRTVIACAEGSSAGVLEIFAGLKGAAVFSNAVTEIAVRDGARVEHCRLQIAPANHIHLGCTAIRLQRDSFVRSTSVVLGAALTRVEAHALFTAPGGECELNGVGLGDGRRLVDHQVEIDHARPHCASRQLFRNVLDNASRGVFSGKVIVRPGAAGTDARQTNQNLLLSDDATIDTKPQLEIYADDVKCSHGATSGRLDDEALFFLRSRGLDEDSARAVLTWAFANEVVGRIPFAGVRGHIEEIVHRRFSALLHEEDETS